MRAHHPISNLIQHVGGLMQLIRRLCRHAVIGERDRPVISMSTRQLVQHLPQQPHRPRHLSHPRYVSAGFSKVRVACANPRNPL